jgi:hypothetical protein
VANTLLTISMITREALRVLENNLVFTKNVRRDFDDAYGKAGAKIGTVLNIRKPPRYLGRTGQALSVEDATETSVPLTLTTQRGVDIQFTSQDLTLSIDDFADRFIKPAVAKVANFIDLDGLAQYVNVYNHVGTPGTDPNALLTYLQAGQKLDENAAPRDGDRALVISAAQQAVIVDALKGLFNDTTEIARQYEQGTMGRTIGFKWSMDQNVGVQTIGAEGGAGTVNGAGQTGASLVTHGWTASVTNLLNAGDIITLAGVYAVNPVSLQSTGSLKQFVVTAAVNSDGSGNATIPISPAITTGTGFQNVTASPANGAAITVYGAAGTASHQALAFHKEAFAMASADLLLPGGVDMAARVADKQLGLSLRMVRAYNINTDAFPCRLDVLYGWATLYPELACRVSGS